MKQNLSVFDIVGPIMIGPSSSHTAGACRIGKTALKIAGGGFTRVDFYLHGSFAKTYKGHGSDKALVGGVLGFEPDDPRIRDSFDYAKERGLSYSFIPMDLGKVHPNTVRIVMTYPDGHEFAIQGSSIGGGNIIINEIDGNQVSYKGKKPTILASYPEQKGVIAFISNVLYDEGYNIDSMQTIKNDDQVMLIVELNEKLRPGIFDKMKMGRNFDFLKYLE